jgi:hypothetical protein
VLEIPKRERKAIDDEVMNFISVILCKTELQASHRRLVVPSLNFSWSSNQNDLSKGKTHDLFGFFNTNEDN